MQNTNANTKKFQISILLIAGIAMFMDAVDSSIVNIILPSLADILHTDTGTISWVSLAYLLVIAGTVLIFGKIADNGRLKQILILGFISFTIGSALCGISPTLEMLIISRIFQGLGASMLISCSPLMCVKYLSPKMLGLSMGLITAISSIGFAIGPALGGIILHFLSWHWVFLINIPIGIALILFALKIVPKKNEVSASPFDFIGSILIFVVMVTGVIFIERIAHTGFSTALILLLIIFAVSAALFIAREFRFRHPLINPRVFSSWRLSAVTAAYLIIQIACLSIIYLLPFYFTVAMNYDSMLSGMLLFIPAILTTVISIPVGKLSDRLGRRKFVIAAVLCLIISAVIYATILPDRGIVPIILGLICLGLFMGLSGGPASSRIIDYMPPLEKGTGATLMVLCLYFGGVLGTACTAGLFTLLTSKVGEAVAFAALPLDTFMYGFHGTFIMAIAIAVIVLILSAVVADHS